MEKPTIEVVLQALDTLHSSQEMDASHRAKANQWLTDLTQSVSSLLTFHYTHIRPTAGPCLGDSGSAALAQT